MKVTGFQIDLEAEALLESLQGRAKVKGVPYTRYVRMLLENDLAKFS